MQNQDSEEPLPVTDIAKQLIYWAKRLGKIMGLLEVILKVQEQKEKRRQRWLQYSYLNSQPLYPNQPQPQSYMHTQPTQQAPVVQQQPQPMVAPAIQQPIQQPQPIAPAVQQEQLEIPAQEEHEIPEAMQHGQEMKQMYRYPIKTTFTPVRQDWEAYADDLFRSPEPQSQPVRYRPIRTRISPERQDWEDYADELLNSPSQI
jgi:hypothetical protein